MKAVEASSTMLKSGRLQGIALLAGPLHACKMRHVRGQNAVKEQISVPGNGDSLQTYQIPILRLCVAFRATVWQSSLSDGSRMQVIKLPADPRCIGHNARCPFFWQPSCTLETRHRTIDSHRIFLSCSASRSSISGSSDGGSGGLFSTSMYSRNFFAILAALQSTSERLASPHYSVHIVRFASRHVNPEF